MEVRNLSTCICTMYMYMAAMAASDYTMPHLPQPKLQAGLAHGERIAQCMHIKLTTHKCIPVQVDGGEIGQWDPVAACMSQMFCIHL